MSLLTATTKPANLPRFTAAADPDPSNSGEFRLMRSQARAVVIGGGVVGASVLYHLAKIGWSDVVLIEKSELTAGSSWHAAGGTHTFDSDANASRLHKYTIDDYRSAQGPPGQASRISAT